MFAFLGTAFVVAKRGLRWITADRRRLFVACVVLSLAMLVDRPRATATDPVYITDVTWGQTSGQEVTVHMSNGTSTTWYWDPGDQLFFWGSTPVISANIVSAFIVQAGYTVQPCGSSICNFVTHHPPNNTGYNAISPCGQFRCRCYTDGNNIPQMDVQGNCVAPCTTGIQGGFCFLCGETYGQWGPWRNCQGGSGGPCANSGGDADGDGCCWSVDCNDQVPELCSNCGPPAPCSTEGGDGDGDGCCANVDLDDGDPNCCSNCAPPPGDCDMNGGDADQDGCCDDVDCNPANPLVCSCPPDDCDEHGGDADEDLCCDDDDADPADPNVCSGPCSEEGGDADRDGCCDGVDQDNEDPEICGRCDDRGGDADDDDCCDDFDSDPEDPEVGCECDERGGDNDEDGCCHDDEEETDDDPDQGCDCGCELDIWERITEVAPQLESWWPSLDDARTAAQGQGPATSGASIIDVTLEIPLAEAPGRQLDVPWTFNPANLPYGFGDAAQVAATYTRAVLLAWFTIVFILSVLELIPII